ncbi:hypothetical protein, partial [Mesorhizobium huakuii]|uniref:hypothetical protein n=1 Tax=Mesorhizobium huakuii TaxID=28104 RepID=UPI0024E04B5B
MSSSLNGWTIVAHISHSSRKSCKEACRKSSSPRKCFTRPMMPGLTHCVAGRFLPFGAGPACSWTRFHSRSRIAPRELMKELCWNLGDEADQAALCGFN